MKRVSMILAALIFLTPTIYSLDIIAGLGSGLILQKGSQPYVGYYTYPSIPIVTDEWAGYQITIETPYYHSDKPMSFVNDDFPEIEALAAYTVMNKSLYQFLWLGLGGGGIVFLNSGGDNVEKLSVLGRLSCRFLGIEASGQIEVWPLEGYDSFFPSLSVKFLTL